MDSILTSKPLHKQNNEKGTALALINTLYNGYLENRNSDKRCVDKHYMTVTGTASKQPLLQGYIEGT